ncbi:MAG: hypothetical protein IPL92_11890 [Saprospiraceae bacterium]|nr:hypothetical protein [Candidatus Opimibacter iunctus]
MDQLFTAILILHIVSGGTGLITGTINLIRRKGDKLHNQIGLVFTYAMISAGASAIVLSMMHPNYFLFIVGVFTLYMVSTGYRYIRLRLEGIDNGPKTLDWVLTGSMGIAGICFILFGGWQLYMKSNFGTVLLVFGAIGILMVRSDLNNYKGQAAERNYWLLAHLQRMTGAYIASLTAFLVVNMDRLPSFIPGILFWLLPTAVLTPMIIFWSRKYRQGVRL